LADNPAEYLDYFPKASRKVCWLDSHWGDLLLLRDLPSEKTAAAHRAERIRWRGQILGPFAPSPVFSERSDNAFVSSHFGGPTVKSAGTRKGIDSRSRTSISKVGRAQWDQEGNCADASIMKSQAK
jgi:hypothetical protein